MAHEIETAMFVGKGAWHGLGTVLDSPPSIDEALVVSGLNWTVSERPLLTTGISVGGLQEVTTGHKAIVRDTDGRVLGVVGAQFKPLQNAKAFEPFGPLVKSGLIDLEAAGSLKKGSRIWILGKIRGAEGEVVPGDTVKGYVLMYQAHDGSLAVSYQKTGIRVVCNNTLSMAVNRGDSGQEHRMQFRHTEGINEQIDRLTETFQAASGEFLNALAHFTYLAHKPCAAPLPYFRNVLNLNQPQSEVTILPAVYNDELAEERMKDGKRMLLALEEAYETQPGVQYGRGTYWQALNAVTYWVDHKRGRTNDTRLNSSWFGDGRRIRERALSIALNA